MKENIKSSYLDLTASSTCFIFISHFSSGRRGGRGAAPLSSINYFLSPLAPRSPLSLLPLEPGNILLVLGQELHLHYLWTTWSHDCHFTILPGEDEFLLQMSGDQMKEEPLFSPVHMSAAESQIKNHSEDVLPCKSVLCWLLTNWKDLTGKFGRFSEGRWYAPTCVTPGVTRIKDHIISRSSWTIEKGTNGWFIFVIK